MKNVGLFLAAFRQAEALKSGVGKGAVVVAGFVASERGDGFDADAKEIVSKGLEKWESFRQELAVVRQIIRVTDFCQLRYFLLRGEPRQIILFLGVDAGDVFADGIGERSFCEELRPRGGVHSRDEAVFTESFFVEKSGGAQFRIELLVVGFEERFRSNADLAKQALGDIAVLAGTLDGLRSAVTQQHPSGSAKFVAFGVPAKIVVIVQD